MSRTISPAPARFAELDSSTLEAALRRHLRGEVRFDSGSRALYATDGSNYRQVPIGVVVPRDNEDVLAAVALCREHNAPLLARGAGTSLAGQCCNTAVVLDFSKYMSSILEIDPARRIARVQPGVVLDRLRAAAEKHHLTFAPDPATHGRCTLGGMIGNNSCGVHSIMAGKTDDNVETLEILTYRGDRFSVGSTTEDDLAAIGRAGRRRAEIYSALKSLADRYSDHVRRQFPNIPRRVSGYNLNHLLPENGFHVARALVGSEGTCVTILEATCRLVASPPARVLLVIGWPDVFTCADHVPQIMQHRPIGLEGFDDLIVHSSRRKGLNLDALAMLPEGGGFLLVEFGAETLADAEAQARRLMADLNREPSSPDMRLFTDDQLARRVWDVRESSLATTAHVPGEPIHWEGFEDSAVSPDRLGAYLRDLRGLMQAHHYDGSFYGHFGHGCIHTRMDYDLESTEGIAKFRRFMEEAADLVVRYGGSLSGEHGDGQSRGELLPRMFGPELIEAFREFKSIWDPDWKMNPGKLIDANRIDENLRLGAGYSPWHPETHFKFPEDHGSLAAATLRCVGVGKCRHDSGGVMCPSYRVTREEEHSTRGRAHLLWEMTKGYVEREPPPEKDLADSTEAAASADDTRARGPIHDGWQSEAVKTSLDLCLACKGCKSDCPVNVDVATYKAEFLSHYYETNRRPFSAIALSKLDLWLEAAARVPGLVNITTQLPILRDIAKAAAGVSPHRRLPALAVETFQQWWRRQNSFDSTPPARQNSQTVLLWADTFNNHFLPSTAKAAVEVLDAAGFHVNVPRSHLCCGRPLYDIGALDRAKSLLIEIMDELLPDFEAGTPIVVLEPSCAAVFRDELTNLFPRDRRAQALSRQVFLLSEFLERHAPEFPLPKLARRALVHGHCHHKAIMRMTAEESVLRRMDIHFTAPAPGCCGMAGAFGFEKDKYNVSAAIGELELLPAVRQTPTDWLIVADGFSCREQIAQETDRHALHLAEVLQMAFRESTETPDGFPMFDPAPIHYPEDAWLRPHHAAINKSMKRTALTLAGIAAGTALLWSFARKRS
jgi:FAD/FMN-containing dehydrogenase/Fe-S oxidoreductase